jgi:predicted site-specific integrase-resolvase
MPKTGKAPKGFYSASQVMKKLGIASSTLYHFVDTGKIRRIVPPNMREGYYVREDVDKLADEKEQFEQIYLASESRIEDMQNQEQSIKRISEKLETIDQRLDQLETKFGEHTTLLNQILARLPKTP